MSTIRNLKCSSFCSLRMPTPGFQTMSFFVEPPRIGLLRFRLNPFEFSLHVTDTKQLSTRFGSSIYSWDNAQTSCVCAWYSERYSLRIVNLGFTIDRLIGQKMCTFSNPRQGLLLSGGPFDKFPSGMKDGGTILFPLGKIGRLISVQH